MERLTVDSRRGRRNGAHHVILAGKEKSGRFEGAGGNGQPNVSGMGRRGEKKAGAPYQKDRRGGRVLGEGVETS